jgi:fermentation-respiration switch protein FrsA (DUF1100 family)
MIVAIGVGAGVIVAIALVRLLENRFIYFPPRYPIGFAPPQRYGLQVEEVWITTEDGVKLSAYFLPRASSSKVLLWFHGNADNIGFGLEQMKALSTLDVNILEMDYRGYGKSEGSPDEAGLYRDADAAYRYLAGTRRFKPENIIIYGHSLGGAVAIELASRQKCGGVIVESSFTSGRDMARRMFSIPLLEYVTKSRFNSIRKIKQVQSPVLVIHGTRDALIPFFMGQALYQAAPEPKEFFAVEGAGHNDVFLIGGERYLRQLKVFILRPSESSRAASTISPGVP